MRPAAVSRTAFALVGVFLGATLAGAEIADCTAIEAFPYTIDTPGVYCLRGDAVVPPSGGTPAITIEASGVTLDLNGHTLDGAGSGTGIYSSGHGGITLRNGRITRFAIGVLVGTVVTDPFLSGHLIEHLEVKHSYAAGIVCLGSLSIIRSNRVANTTGWEEGSVGIWIIGQKNHVLDNDVTDTVGDGIRMDRADAAVVEGNRVTSTTGVGGTQGSPAHAIHVMNSKGVQVVGNRIANLETVPNSYGLRVWNSTNVAARDNVVNLMVFGVAYLGSSSGKYMGNLTTGVNVPYTYGTAAGPNY